MRLLLPFIFSLLIMPALGISASDEVSKKKVKVVYKKHTQLDFTGGEIRGKIKTPAVYYIFQRKRTKEHHVINPVTNFNGHKDMTLVALKKSLNK